MTQVHLSIDVPELDDGVDFYSRAFELEETSRPLPSLAILSAENAQLCIHAKPAGSQPTPRPGADRAYSRHWTSMHADFHVEHFEECVARVVRQGGRLEQLHRLPGQPSAAFCSDPFGNGFCVIGPDCAEEA